jgi:quinol monooxygenase YgiN
MFVVTGLLTVDPADFVAFEHAVREVTRAARTADGCCSFAVGVENAAAGAMLVVEHWRERSAQQAFLQQPAFQEFARCWAAKMQNGLQLFDAQPVAG